MTDSPVPLAAHPHPDLSIDQKHALKTAATRSMPASTTSAKATCSPSGSSTASDATPNTFSPLSIS